jgi:hypothetical protein
MSYTNWPAELALGRAWGNHDAALMSPTYATKTRARQLSSRGVASDTRSVASDTHRDSDAVMRNCSPAAVRAMGIRPIEEGGAR